MRIIRKNDSGPAVEDVQQRLRMLGFELSVDGQFQTRTQEAVRKFRAEEELPAGDVIDQQTWSALVDATFSLGDRMLYLRMPYFHGYDVRTLQNILEVLGFVVGDPDGIFGAHTEHALRDFQTSVGIEADGIAGTTTYDAIERLRHAWEGKSPASEENEDHMGFARAAEALKKVEACFYGLDGVGREVSSRAANLALATTPDAIVVSAESLETVPAESMLKLGVGQFGSAPQDGTPVVELTNDFSFSKRLRTAIDTASRKHNRVVIEVAPNGVDSDGNKIAGELWEQHLAVILLDAFCNAIR